MDRASYPTRLLRLHEEGGDADVRSMEASRRLAMVWQLTLEAWTFKEGRFDEPRLRRDVVRLTRAGG